MKNHKETIRKMVGYLNNHEKDGGFWLPNIQRPFVWGEGQIERLFDSIMREYPIGTLLVWKTRSEIRRRKFIENYRSGLKLADFYVPEDNALKLLVLDGQQRLQSLFIGLLGSYDKKELHFHVLSGEQVAPEDIKFRFRFLDSQTARAPWMKFKDLVFSKAHDFNDISDEVCRRFDKELSRDEQRVVSRNVSRIVRVFQVEENILYQEIDSSDSPDLYTEDDVVEVFIRANSGGTILGKSDLLFALLTASWDDADEKIAELLEDLNAVGYAFTRDFVLKTCLSLLDMGAAYNITKFRKPEIKEKIASNWDQISSAIRDVRDFVWGKTYVRSDKALTSYLALIPLIYFRYKHPKKWTSAKGFDQYLLRTLLTGAFGGNPDRVIDRCTHEIAGAGDFKLDDLYRVIRADGRSLEVAKEDILGQHYTSKEIHLLFNIWYGGFNYSPIFRGNSPQLDHIFPQKALKAMKIENPATGRKDLLQYKWLDRDQIGNMMLLSQRENGPGGKGSKLPEEWFKDKEPEYLELHLIPKDPELWKLANYERFLEARQSLIMQKFEFLAQKTL